MIDQIRKAKAELAAICRRHNVRQLDIFGSALGPDFDPITSDLDFLVDFGPFSKGEYSEHYFALIDDLKALFGRPVDLVVSRAIRNPYLLEELTVPASSYMPRDARKYLFDIDEAASLIVQFTAGRSLQDYLKDKLLRSAVERQFEIMGEALGQLAKLDQALAAQISEYQRIISFRNVLIHGYAEVDDELVWDIIETRVPVLQEEVDRLSRGASKS